MSAQAIAGVSPGTESIVMTEHPSIAAGMFGQALGSFYDCIPVKIFGVQISHLLFVLPTAPLAVFLYFVSRAFGEYFVLTNRSVQIWGARGGQRKSSVALADVANVEVSQTPGQRFYRAHDILLRNRAGAVISRPCLKRKLQPFANAIRNIVESRRQVQSALQTIEARGA